MFPYLFTTSLSILYQHAVKKIYDPSEPEYNHYVPEIKPHEQEDNPHEL